METTKQADKVSRRAGGVPPERCPNCGAAVRGPFCHRCGQRHRSRIAPLSAFFRDAFAEHFSFDHRLWQTLWLLIRRPGFLTDEYLAGRRARYTRPLRLYLLASATYFVLQAFAPQAGVFFGVLNVETADSTALRRWLPRLMFALVPVFALLLKGLYARLRRVYVEHLIFSLHYFSFYFALNALLIPMQQITAAIGGAPRLALTFTTLSAVFTVLAPVVYLIFAVHRVYEPSPAWSVVKGAGLYIAYLVVFGVFLAALFTVGIAG